ncbi:pseudouridine synthase [Cardiosporidium cionae]|uniref:tRNA pseudouridine synthase n=1 Tax=Cardiosporidium cionae TaxID=476202 RepID=A0ABQ7JG80_9APIC|nr:pseudouridine synthase [Cardiosporidium cionae]|eukprot:KAF8823002.1 pseudouridine synthase [Cardiosporidium cionae]
MALVKKVALKVSYFGSNFHGVCYQPQENIRTVECEFFKAALKTKLIEDIKSCEFSRCGRTDKGVHAAGNYFALYLQARTGNPGKVTTEESESATSDYRKILNGVLPTDIRILQAQIVPTEFNARFDCRDRVYKYFFEANDMDIGKMEAASEYFINKCFSKQIGEHDFRQFCKIDPRKAMSFRRRIISIKIEKICTPMYVATVCGTAFLWHQVRYMMAALFKVGKGEEDTSFIFQLLGMKNTPMKKLTHMAPAEGLVLFDCHFNGLIFDDKDEQFHARGIFRKLYYETFRTLCIYDCLSSSQGSETLLLSTLDTQDHISKAAKKVEEEK